MEGFSEVYRDTIHGAFLSLAKRHRRRSAKLFQEIGLSEGQPKVLDFLAIHDGCIQKDLATYCNIKPATVTSVLNGMEKAQLIYRKQNSDDKRIYNVYLTEEGKKRQKEVQEIFRQIDEVCLQNFTREEREQAIYLLNKMYDNLGRGERRC